MPSALVMGAGVAGLTAAHELAERGFQVVVLERRDAVGGKARSLYGAPQALGPGAERYLESAHPWAPGEHGFRFFPGFYRHVIDSMRRIPAGEGRSAADSLVATTQTAITQYGREMLLLPARFPRTPGELGVGLGALLKGVGPLTGLTTEDLAFFAGRIWQILTSCPERRLAEYETVPWWTFIDAEGRSEAYRKMLAQSQTRSVVAAQARKASARTVGTMFIQLVGDIVDPTAGNVDEVLDGPTTDVWLNPWREHLRRLGVDLRTGTEVREIRCEQGRITSVVAVRDGRAETVEADHYVCALPLERVVPLMSHQILAADPALSSLGALAVNTEWMNGVQFYLFKDVPMVHGHLIHIDSEWALTSISQVQFWRPEWYARYLGDIEFDGILSVDISDWTAPGGNGRVAAECTPDEVAAEVWNQLKRSVNSPDHPAVLDDANLAGWMLDPGISPDPARPGRLANLEPLLVNYMDTWRLRPEPRTAIPNLYLAGDYVRTHTDLATMEGANESARRAVNALLDSSGETGPRCEVWPLEENPIFEPWRSYDAARFRVGLPWDSTLLEAASAALSTGALGAVDPVLAGVAGLVARVEPFAAARPVDNSPESVSRLAGGCPQDEGPSDFSGRLAWYRELAMAELAAAIPVGEPARHLYDLVREYVNRPSKGLRPALCLATCRAHGGSTATAVPAAAGLEMLHNAFLVHDDVEDAGRYRRGRPAMHREAGVPLAVNAGDAMNALAMRLFRRTLDTHSPAVALRIFDEVDHLLVETLEGQAMELGWIRDNACGVDTDDYLRLVLKKTAWYSFIHPMRIGALLAAGSAADPPDLGRFDRLGFLLGAAFQIQDDLLNLIGDESRYGKEIGGDLDEGKRTLVLTHALAHASPPDRLRLEHFLARAGRPRLAREHADVHDLLARTGSLDWARQAGAELAAAAEAELATAFAGASPGPDLEFVRSLVGYVVRREV